MPPRLYGGTERVVSYLTEELVRQGDDVTLFATGDSITRARLVPCVTSALRLEPRCESPLPHYMRMFEEVRRRRREFDLVHFHIDYLHFPLMREMGLPHVTTLHGRQDLWDLEPLFAEYTDMPLVSISDSQRSPVERANWVATVYHGLPRDLLPFSPRGGDYLAFVGRIAAEKRVDRAIEIATRADRELVIAAKIDKADREYFEADIKPLLNNPNVRYIGEVNDREKAELLGGALALLFPIDWPEPFGLTMIESMACGTPVVGWRCGSVPEIIADGVSGRIVESIYEAVEAIDELAGFDRRLVRDCFEHRFSVERMASDYRSVYDRLVERHVTSVNTAA
ncbi:MAG TPA: glycosyltransferase family 4 protein [Woeseiaceae bacterium]|nr:glycosyltransferase family 4 protein [Woeseiaceae bacterium]